LFVAGEIWSDTKHLFSNGVYVAKYVIVLAVGPSGDALVIRLTTKPKGLPSLPACHHGAPRSGYFVGIPGAAPLHRETWAVFDDFFDLDSHLVATGIGNGRYVQTGTTFPAAKYCALLRCAIQSDDITKKQRNMVYSTIEACNC
jgi:hypothetical protein